VDNWYTTMDLVKHLYEHYGWTLVGMMTPTEKKSRSDHDVPSLKLSNGGLKVRAVVEIKTKHNRRYFIQCTTWRDKN